MDCEHNNPANTNYLFTSKQIKLTTLFFIFRNKPNQNSPERVAQTYSVHPNTALPSSSNYGYVPDTLDESTSQRTQRDYQQTDDTDHHSLSAVVNNTDANSIPIRFPSDQLTSEGIDSRESTDSPTYDSRHNTNNSEYIHYQKPRRDVSAQSLWHNPSFMSEMSEEPRHNTDNYQRYLWNKMRDSPQVSSYTDNTYDEIENQHHAIAMQTYGRHNEHSNEASRFYAPAKV